MSTRRLLKAAQAIREVVSMAILTELKDPRVQDVTVTSVSVAPDMRTAKVNVSVRGDDKKQELSLRGLQASAGFLQHLIAKRIDTRYTPVLQFALDQGVKRSIEVATILREVLPREEAEEEQEDAEQFADEAAQWESAAEDGAEQAGETDDDDQFPREAEEDEPPPSSA
jgi:ribosome-binding factor A